MDSIYSTDKPLDSTSTVSQLHVSMVTDRDEVERKVEIAEALATYEDEVGPENEALRFKKGEKILLETDISPMVEW